MLKKTMGFLLLIGIILSGCSSSDDLIEKSSEKEITEFELEGQVGLTQFEGDNIFVKVSNEVYLNSLSSLSATSIKVSDNATVLPGVDDVQDFSKVVTYTVTAENGSSKNYYVNVQSAGDDDIDGYQIPNSNFDLWYKTGKYYEIGLNEKDKIWGTGNKGAAIILKEGDTFPSMPFEKDPTNFAAKLTTLNMGTLAGGLLGGYKGIAAGSVFLGELKVSGMTVYPIFGYPYTEKPTAFEVEYKYTPKAPLLNGKLETIEGADALDMYLILEKREGNNVKRLGVAWYRSGETQTEWKTIKIDIKYAHGTAPAGLEDYQKRELKYGDKNGANQGVTDPTAMPFVTWGNIDTESPTHIVMAFTSSCQGDYFIGAPGSELLVDNFKLIYQ